MKKPIAYWNGQIEPHADIAVDAFDAGFVWGVTISERMRTYAGQVVFLDRHLERFERGVQIVGHHGVHFPSLEAAIGQVAQNNYTLLDEHQELAVSLFATPGILGAHGSLPLAPMATLGVTATPLPIGRWAHHMFRGAHVCTVDVQEIANASIPKSIKCRSRMHYWLADRQARQTDPAAYPLLLNAAGEIAESSTSLVAAYLDGEGIIAPPADEVSASVTFAVVEQEFGDDFRVVRRSIKPEELAAADEIFLFSAPFPVLPVSQLDGRAIGDSPGPVYRGLMERFSQRVGCDLLGQAGHFRR